MANQLQDIRDFADNHNLDNLYLALEKAIAPMLDMSHGDKEL